MAAVPVAIRRAVYERDGHRCVYCGATEESMFADGYMPMPAKCYRLTLDHLIPRCHGGTDDDWNLATACHHCNTSRQEEPWPRSLEVLAENLAGLRAA